MKKPTSSIQTPQGDLVQARAFIQNTNSCQILWKSIQGPRSNSLCRNVLRYVLKQPPSLDLTWGHFMKKKLNIYWMKATQIMQFEFEKGNYQRVSGAFFKNGFTKLPGLRHTSGGAPVYGSIFYICDGALVFLSALFSILMVVRLSFCWLCSQYLLWCADSYFQAGF